MSSSGHPVASAKDSSSRRGLFSEDAVIIFAIGVVWIASSGIYGFIGMAMPAAEFVWRVGGVLLLLVMVAVILSERRGRRRMERSSAHTRRGQGTDEE